MVVLAASCDRHSSPTRLANESLFAEASPFQTQPEPLWIQNLRASEQSNQKASIAAIHDGHAEFSIDDGKTWKLAVAEMEFSPPAIIRTDAEGTVDLSLGSDPESNPQVIRLLPSSYLRILQLNAENTGIEKVSETMIEIERGKITGYLHKMAAASTFMIRNQKGIIEPFGQFEATADGMVRADAGRVYTGGATYPIVPGQEFLF
jgi:hypothetical protein